MLVCRSTVEPSKYGVWDPINRPWWTLPLWDITVPCKHVALSSSPKDYNSICAVMVLTGIQKPAFAFYDKGCKYEWFKQDSTLWSLTLQTTNSCNSPMPLHSKESYYALSLQETLAVMENIDSHFSITSLSTNKAVPSIPSMRFKEYLIESNGEFFWVFLVSKKSIHIVKNVDVYRLRYDRLSWAKMESIGKRTLFVGANCCMTVNASKMGCRENCIYFTSEKVDKWWVYDMERRNISPGWKNSDSTTKSPVWDEPIS